MALTTVSLAIPGSNGVGASSDVSTLDTTKSFVVNGSLSPSETLVIEGSADPVGTPDANRTWNGVIAFTNASPGKVTFDNQATSYRVRRRLVTDGFSPSVDVASTTNGTNTQFTLTVPTPTLGTSGVGPSTDVSAGGSEVSFYVGGTINTDGGEVISVEGSQNNVNWDGLVSFAETPGANIQVLNYKFLRVRRINSSGLALSLFAQTATSAGGGGAFPGYAPPGSITPNEPVAGVAATVLRSDSLPGQKIQAAWALAGCRFYAIDTTNGNDANSGFADSPDLVPANLQAACALAGTRALKTFAQLGILLPRIGNARRVVVVVASGTYAEDIGRAFYGVGGYATNFPILVGTSTNATAGAVAFSGSANDRIYAGFVTATGMFGAGYNPIGALSRSSIQCLQVGGGAPAFPAEPATPTGWRVRFDNATTTAALRNVCAPIIGVVGTDTLTLPAVATGSGALPVAPAITDTFYIEQGGLVSTVDNEWVLNANAVGPGSLAGNQLAMQVVGLRSTVNTRVTSSSRVVFCGCEHAFLTGFGSLAGISSPFAYNDETGTVRQVGCGMVLGGSSSFFGAIGINPQTLNNQFVARAGLGITEAIRYNVGNGTLINGNVLIECSYSLTTMRALSGGISEFGGSLQNGMSAVRIISAAFDGGLSIDNSQVLLGRIIITGMGAFPAIRVRGRNAFNVSDQVSGSTGNNDVGMDLTQSADSTIILIGLPTVTGALGDIRLSDGTIITWAQALASGIVDANGNRIIPVGNTPTAVVAKFTGSLASAGDGSAQTSYMADPGSNVLATVVALPNNATRQRYSTSLRFISRIRATLITANPFSIPFAITLYKNGVATVQAVAFINGAAAGVKSVDLIHPILFADGDDFDVRMELAAGNVNAGTVIASTVLEGYA